MNKLLIQTIFKILLTVVFDFIIVLLLLSIMISFISAIVDVFAPEADAAELPTYNENMNKWLDTVLKEDNVEQKDIKEKCLQSYYKGPFYIYNVQSQDGFAIPKLKNGNPIRCGVSK